MYIVELFYLHLKETKRKKNKRGQQNGIVSNQYSSQTYLEPKS